MTDAIVQRSLSNSEMAIAKEKRAFLQYPRDGLAACTLQALDDGVVLRFETTGLEPAKTMMDKPKQDGFRFLVNCAALESLDTQYWFSLSLDNLLVDINLRPQVLTRDIRLAGGLGFLPRYKALVGSMVQRRYRYDDYLNGGNDLYKKNSLLSEIADMGTVNAVKDRLLQEYRTMVREAAQTKQLVSKRSVWLSWIAIPVLAMALIVAGYFAVRSVVWDIPYRDSVIQANAAYIAGDFVGSQQVLQGYSVTKLSSETKYFLSRSYVSTEALTEKQKSNVLIGLTPKTDCVIFDYWIYLGRMDFDEAIDIAQRYGDDELLLFAYLKYEVVVRSDTTMSGQDKTALLDELRGKIEALQQARAQAEEDAPR